MWQIKPFVLCWTEHNAAVYRQEFLLQYSGTVVTTSNRDLYKAELEAQLPAVQSALQAQCDNSLVSETPDVLLDNTVTFLVIGETVCVCFSIMLSWVYYMFSLSLVRLSVSGRCCLDGSSVRQPIFCCPSNFPDTCPFQSSTYVLYVLRRSHTLATSLGTMV